MRTIVFGVAFSVAGLAGLVGLAGCSGDVGPAGPAGTAGVTGANGAPGTAGGAGAQGNPGAAGTPGAAGAPGATGPQGPPGNPDAGVTDAPAAVYTLSNDPTLNEVVVYTRAADGALTPFGSYSTGGRGTGAGLGDQGALVFDAARKAFYAVNAGDNSISMLGLRPDGSLALLSKIGSGGTSPISLSLAGDVLYTVNSGDATHVAQISGFRVHAAGLDPIASSTQPLSAANPGPAQIQFTPDGALLVVTEKGTNKIDTFVVTAGVAGAVKAQTSAGTTPFGFAFGPGNKLIVSEAFGGGAGLGATSSYSLAADGTITAVTSSKTSAQTAPCWVAVNGTHAYVANTGSATVTAYTIAADGTLALVSANGVSGSTGAAPADEAFTTAGDFFYTRNGGDHSLSIFAVAADGSLTKKSDFAGIPQSSVGLVAR